MKKTYSSSTLRAMTAVIAVAFSLVTAAGAQYTPQTLYTFPQFEGAAAVPSGLVFDHAGNLYGTTNFLGSCGNPANCGTVFELSPVLGGGWTETTLYSFPNDTTAGSSLTIDSAGNLYGVTFTGGGDYHASCSPYGCGTVFELSPSVSGWTYTLLHSFSGPDGGRPYGPPVFDTAGNLYGTTSVGGGISDCTCGTIYELSPTSGGGWTFKSLHYFTGGNDGKFPQAALVMDGAGNFYGTAYEGGADNVGTVFKLTPNGTGHLTFGVIHSFVGGQKGAYPFAPLLLDMHGNLYGTTQYGGSLLRSCTAPVGGCGIVFELELLPSGGYAEKILRILQPSEDGAFPQAGVVADSAGNLYGSSSSANKDVIGTVFELSPTASGYSETILLTGSSGGYGTFLGGVILDSSGNLYGPSGGSIIFELSPPTPAR
jgi:uncharacterized repeat protein (TIGR03803 family)